MRDINAIMRDIDRAFPGSRAQNLLRVASAVSDGEIVTINGNVYEFDVGDGVTAGNVKIDVSAGGTKASSTLTSTNTDVADGDIVTIGGKVYTFKTTLSGVEGQVHISGVSADATLLNLINAINHTGTPGTDYVAAAQNPSVSAATSVTSHTFAITARITGTGGNAITTTTASGGTNRLSFTGSTLAGGANPTAAQAIAAIVIAINTNTTQSLYGAQAAPSGGVIVYSLQSGRYTFACSTTMAGSNNAWAAAAMFAGDPQKVPQAQKSQRVPNATEVAIGYMSFAFPFAPSKVQVSVKTTSTGARVAWDGNVTITNNIVFLDNAGSTDWATTSTVLVDVQE